MATKLIWVHRKDVLEANNEMGFVEVSEELAVSLIDAGVAQDPSDPDCGELIYLEGDEPEGYVVPDSRPVSAKPEAKTEEVTDSADTDNLDDMADLLGVPGSAEEQATGAQ